MMNLGELIDAVEPYKDVEGWVMFDFGSASPDGIDSYRGYYDRLALGFSGERSDIMTPKDFYILLTSAVNKTFTGYKGGKYTMDRDTPVHVANYGETSSTEIVRVHAEKDDRLAWIYLITVSDIDEN